MPATLEQLEDALRKADAAGNTSDAKAIADEIRRVRATPAPRSGRVPYMPGMEAPIAMDAPTPEDVDASRAMTAGALRMSAAPVAVATGGASIPAYLAMAGAGATGEFLARRVEGRPIEPRKEVGAGVANAFLSSAPIVRGMAAPMLSGRGLLNAASGAAQLGGQALAANFIEQAVGKGTVVPFESLKEELGRLKLPAIIGAVTGAAGGRAARAALNADDIAKNREALKQLGIDNPMLGDVVPLYGPMEQRAANTDRTIASRIQQSRLPAVNKFKELVGDSPSNEEIAAALQPLVPKMDALDAAYTQAEQAAARAADVAAKAKANTMIPPQQSAQILAQASASELNSIATMARAAREAQIVADSVRTQTGRAENMQGVVKHLYNARGRIAEDMMQATGISATEPLFDKATLLSAAKRAMGPRADSVAGKRILDAIDKAKEAPKITDVLAPGQTNVLTVEQSRALQQQLAGKSDAQMAKVLGGQTTQQQVLMTLPEFRQLRDKIGDAFVGLPENTMRSNEQLASLAYGAMGDASKAAILTRYGPEGLSRYGDFLAFWRKTSQLRDSDFGRALLRGEVADSTITGMAEKLAKGEVDEMKNFRQFVETIGSQEPEAAKMAMSTMAGAVRNSLLEKATEGGRLNYNKLATQLGDVAKYKDAPFPVETFGFGNAEAIQAWNKVLKEFKPSDLSPKAIEEVMEGVVGIEDYARKTGLGSGRSILTKGEGVAPRLRQIMAAKAFNKRALDANALMAAGHTKEAQAAYAEAADFARKAQIDVKTAEKAVQEAMNDPVISVFRGKGDFKFTNLASMEGPGTVNDFLNGLKREEASKMLSGLARTNPQTAEMVRRRYLAGEFNHFMSPQHSLPGEPWKLDSNKVREYFAPSPLQGRNTQADKTRAIVGDRVFNDFKLFATNLAKLDDQTRGAIIAAKLPLDAPDVAGIAMGLGTGSVMRAAAARGVTRRLLDDFNRGRYNLLSAMIMDDGLKNELFRAEGDFTKAIGALPTQKAALILADRQLQEELGE